MLLLIEHGEVLAPEPLGEGPVLAVGGSWFVAKDLINGKKFDEITKLTAAAVSAAKAARA